MPVVKRRVSRVACMLLAGALSACAPAPEHSTPPSVGQWIWTRADLERYAESAAAVPQLGAAVLIGSVQCDSGSGRLIARAGLSASSAHAESVTAVIRFEDGLLRCRVATAAKGRFAERIDSVVHLLRERARSASLNAVQLDYDAPQRSLGAWAATVAYLHAHALRDDSIWVTSIIAHLREPEYGELFRDVVSGHVLQVFDTGEPATVAQVQEAVRLATRAHMPFRLGLGAFERETRAGRTDHRAWFATVPEFAAIDGYRGVWVFPAGRRWISLLPRHT